VAASHHILSGEISAHHAGAERAPSCPGLLIVNADDWGRDGQTTDRILECALHGSVSSASAMVFMEDSERAAALAREHGVDCGLHLNFTARFSAHCPRNLSEHQQRLIRYLRGNRLAQVFFHPGLVKSFEYVVGAQLEEFERLFGASPRRVDGHHHMHLCANLLRRDLLPLGVIARRSFSFGRGEKSWLNRIYRRSIDRRLARRHRLTDYFFSLPPLEPARLKGIFQLAQESVVEVETHPVVADEHRFLTGGEFERMTKDLRLAKRYEIPEHQAEGQHGSN
jgi:chitin disaccharide deacetylase